MRLKTLVTYLSIAYSYGEFQKKKIYFMRINNQVKFVLGEKWNVHFRVSGLPDKNFKCLLVLISPENVIITTRRGLFNYCDAFKIDRKKIRHLKFVLIDLISTISPLFAKGKISTDPRLKSIQLKKINPILEKIKKEFIYCSHLTTKQKRTVLVRPNAF